jgi:replicative DNA helicase
MPDLSDLRESGDLEQDADVVIGLDREDYHDREAATHVAQMAILKARDSAGERGRGLFIDLAWVSRYEFYGDLIKERGVGGGHVPQLHDDVVAEAEPMEDTDLPW